MGNAVKVADLESALHVIGGAARQQAEEWTRVRGRQISSALIELMSTAGVDKDRIDDKSTGIIAALDRMHDALREVAREAGTAEHILNRAQQDVRKALAAREASTGFVIN